MTDDNGYDRNFFRLLEMSPFERRPGGWRFGAKRISDSVVQRLLASGRVEIAGAHVRLKHPPDDAVSQSGAVVHAVTQHPF